MLLKKLALSSIAAGIDVPDGIFNRISENYYLRRMLRVLQINCVIDVGANRGQFVESLRGLGYQGRIASFEPVAAVYAELKQRFKGDPQWVGYPFALGAASRTDVIGVPALSVLSSFLEPLSSAGIGERRYETVNVRCLDEVFDDAVSGIEHPRVLLKMDTQGYDVEIFRGAASSLGRIVGLVSEVSVQPKYEGMPHFLEALGEYERNGYLLWNISVVAREPDGGLVELNCFLRRLERHSLT